MTPLMRFLTSVIPPGEIDTALREYTLTTGGLDGLDDRKAVESLSASEVFLWTVEALTEKMKQKDDKWAGVATILSMGIGMGVALAAGMAKEEGTNERTSSILH